MPLNLADSRPTSRFNLHSSNVSTNLNDLDVFQHQREALGALATWYQTQARRIALVLIPTGGGKSGIAALAPYILNTTRVLVITPSVQISTQLANDFGRSPKKSFYVKRSIVEENDAHDFVEPLRMITKGQEMSDISENLVIVNAQKFGTNSSVEWGDLNPARFDLLIVDEAHHFPAPTWNKIVEYFRCKTIFLTATPYRRGVPILGRSDTALCYQSTRAELENAGVIRRLEFEEVGRSQDPEEHRWTAVCTKIFAVLDEHDSSDTSFKHQAMVLTRLTGEANNFSRSANIISQNLYGNECVAAFTGETSNTKDVLNRFEQGQIRVLVVCGKLLEGYDRKEVSVCAILRKVAPQSKVLFTQFVGRCLRMHHPGDPVTAKLLSHVFYDQEQNYTDLNEIAEVDPDDDDEQ